jgi:hypothetical protein
MGTSEPTEPYKTFSVERNAQFSALLSSDYQSQRTAKEQFVLSILSLMVPHKPSRIHELSVVYTRILQAGRADSSLPTSKPVLANLCAHDCDCAPIEVCSV